MNCAKYITWRKFLQVKFISYLAQDFSILRKILQVTRFYFFKTCNKLHKLRKFMQYWAWFCKSIFFFISCARFCNIAQDFASFKILFFQKFATNCAKYITWASLGNIVLDFTSKIFPHILRNILQYCARFCKF